MIAFLNKPFIIIIIIIIIIILRLLAAGWSDILQLTLTCVSVKLVPEQILVAFVNDLCDDT